MQQSLSLWGQGLTNLVHWFLLFFFSHGATIMGFSCSSSHMGLMVLAYLILLFNGANIIGSCCYFHMGLLLWVPLVFLLTWGCYFFSLVIILFFLLLLLFIHYFSLFIHYEKIQGLTIGLAIGFSSCNGHLQLMVFIQP